jgi:hypothetical protein
VDASCLDCVLKLSVVEKQVVDGRIAAVVLALDFAAPAGVPLPSLADIRIKVGGSAQLAQVATGEVLIAAGKDFVADPSTGKPFRELPGGILQVLVYSGSSAATFGAGRVAFFKFLLKQPTEPATFSLVIREQTFAPPAADQLLWGGGYDGAVVVWPDQVEPGAP